MFTMDEFVRNQETGQLGKVIGYGHQIINNVYTVTLKVLVAETANSRKRVFVVEDTISAWSHWVDSLRN
ncbi:hypothetical protein BV372_20310 [Nostoc sp. T09]|uniref:hypothetical protein n=1 Tax=Nostoc sp. T09 TaxID=1932621 RepID=UPI000A39BD68|nr:hypothetical protein [Nostoc sp. T09]OUL31524.1 hypothetical protein BV372_20310 [Nostoc sp. T09]